MWKLTSNGKESRVYTNTLTNSQCSQTLVHTDKEFNTWWEFDSLTAIPYTRNFAATKISSLYALGLSKDDLNGHIAGLKAILKSQDKEKYEKAFALVLDFESKASNATDAIKQMSSLVCVYYTINDEHIDSIDNSIMITKMSLLEGDPEMHTFFLTRQIEATERYTNFLNSISQIASRPHIDLLAPIQQNSKG